MGVFGRQSVSDGDDDSATRHDLGQRRRLTFVGFDTAVIESASVDVQDGRTEHGRLVDRAIRSDADRFTEMTWNELVAVCNGRVNGSRRQCGCVVVLIHRSALAECVVAETAWAGDSEHRVEAGSDFGIDPCSQRARSRVLRDMWLLRNVIHVIFTFGEGCGIHVGVQLTS
jgi:hypothetical protein